MNNSEMHDENGEFAPEKVAASKSFHRWLSANTQDKRVGAWTTQDEITFLTRLGEFSDYGRQIHPRSLLDSYERAMSRRSNWDAIDREQVSSAIAWIRAKG